MSGVIITNIPHNPVEEEIAGSMLIVSDSSLQKAWQLLTQAAKDSRYTKIASVEIKMHTTSNGDIFLIYGTPVRPSTWRDKGMKN